MPMSDSTDRVVGFCDQYVRISCDSPAAVSMVDFLCADLHVDPGISQHVAPRAVCELVMAGDDRSMTLRRGGEPLYQGTCQRGLAYALINEIIFQCLEDNDSGLAIHAAAVQSKGGGILLPGNSGAGKSTFTAWLTARGCGYLTDELVVISDDAYRIHPFTRPLTIRSEAATALSPYVNFNSDEILVGDSGFMVPHRLLNSAFQSAVPPLALILFPRYRAGAPPELTELSPGLGCSRLMECYVNARNIPGHGISGLAEITKKNPIRQLTYGSFTGLGTLLADALPEFFRDIFSRTR